MIPSDTPLSFLTNIAYVLAGIYILRGLVQKAPVSAHPSRITYTAKHRLRTPASWLVGLAFIILGVGSGLHHYFNTTNAPPLVAWAQLADERSMYLLFSVLAGVLWAPRWINPATNEPYGWEISAETRWGDYVGALRFRPVLVWLGLAIGVILASFAHLPALDSMWMMPALAILCLAAVGVGQSWARALKFFIAFLAIAAIRELPEANFWGSDPLFSYDQIHALWHLGTGIFINELYLSTEG